MKSVDKKYFGFNKGINTEAPLVAWPDGYTVDEQNWDLLQDGSRRRRLGLSYEAGSSPSFFSSDGASTDMSSGSRFYRWRNVNNTDEFNFIVCQVGSRLSVWRDPISGPLGVPELEFDLLPYKVTYGEGEDAYAALDEDIAKDTVTFAEAEGKLVVAGPNLKTLALSFEDNVLTGEEIKFVERDLFGIDDSIAVDVTPEVLTDSHKYNLFCRGWLEADIDTVFDQKAVYPAKNMIAFMGLRRQTESGFSDTDGVRVFSPDKLFNEFFQNMSAPRGHITRDPFYRQIGYGSLGQGSVKKTVANITEVNTNTGDVTIKSEEDAHGVLVDDSIQLSECKVLMVLGFSQKKLWLDGNYTVKSLVDANTFIVNIPIIKIEGYRYLKTLKRGSYTVGGTILIDAEGFEPSTTRFGVVASFSGRLFYGGCSDARLSDRIYFSKVIEDDSDFGKCYQEADPTSEFISDLLPTDGGYIVIPNLGTLKALTPYGGALLALSSEGVWLIGPGPQGLFAATGYSLRKITDAGCLAPQSVILADNVPMYWSTSGIYAIIEDSNSGFLSAKNVSQDTINSLFHSIRHEEKKRVKGCYDSVRKRVFYLYNSRLVNPPDGNPSLEGEASEFSTSVTPIGVIDDADVPAVTYDSALIFDLRLGAWVKWYFADKAIWVRDALCLATNYDSGDLNGALRILCQEDGTKKFYIGGITGTDYKDWNTEAPAFLYTGPDSLGEPERFRYAPYVHVFMRKENNVPIVVDQDPDALTQAAVNSDVDLTVAGKTPSLFMQPRWDWARGSNSGKINNYVQVYRESRKHPEAFGMVVTKNKIRGRGRNLFLAFKAGPGAPAWLDGWTVKYDAQVTI